MIVLLRDTLERVEAAPHDWGCAGRRCTHCGAGRSKHNVVPRNQHAFTPEPCDCWKAGVVENLGKLIDATKIRTKEAG